MSSFFPEGRNKRRSIIRGTTILKCIYANLQSIFSKKQEIEILLRESKLDILFFTECFITEGHDISEYQFPGFQSFVAMKYRGGSCIYVQNDLPAYAVQPPNAVEDSAWVVITTREGTKRLYGCIYRSPNYD